MEKWAQRKGREEKGERVYKGKSTGRERGGGTMEEREDENEEESKGNENVRQKDSVRKILRKKEKGEREERGERNAQNTLARIQRWRRRTYALMVAEADGELGGGGVSTITVYAHVHANKHMDTHSQTETHMQTHTYIHIQE